MKLFFFLFFAIFSTNSVLSQSVKTKSDSTSLSSDNKVYSSVEEKPEYVGGIIEFYNFAGRNYRVPNVRGLKGRVIVQFIVEKDGSLSGVKVLKDLGHGTGDEAVRVLKKCQKWIPGKQNGTPVRALYSLPINIAS